MEEAANSPKKGILNKALDLVERMGNKLPDPAILFFYLLIFVWVLSAILSPFDFGEVHPMTGNSLNVQNLLTGTQLAAFLASMVNTSYFLLHWELF